MPVTLSGNFGAESLGPARVPALSQLFDGPISGWTSVPVLPHEPPYPL